MSVNGERKKKAIRPDFNGSIRLDFQGAKLSSDTGFLLLREIDERFGILEGLGEALEDKRSSFHTRHSMVQMVRQRVYQIAAGCEWGMNCDLRVAVEGTKFGFPEVRIGGTVTNADTKMLPLLVGLARAKELVFTTEIIDAAQAESWGLVNKVVPLEKLESETLELAKKITQHSTLAIALSKKALNQGVYLGFEETLNQETKDILMVLQTLESAQRAEKALAATKKPKKGQKNDH